MDSGISIFGFVFQSLSIIYMLIPIGAIYIMYLLAKTLRRCIKALELYLDINNNTYVGLSKKFVKVKELK